MISAPSPPTPIVDVDLQSYDDAAFRALLADLVARPPVLAAADVPCLPTAPWLRVGIEIEFDLADAESVAVDLFELGLGGHPAVLPHRASTLGIRRPATWWVARDSTVPEGAEVVSPPLPITPDSFRSLQLIADVLASRGAQATPRTSLHVHVNGADLSDHQIGRSVELVYRYQPVLFRMARVAPSERDLTYCQPIPPGVYASPQSTLEQVRRYQDAELRGHSREAGHLQLSHWRRFILNCGNFLGDDHPLANDRRTLEFRHANGTFDPAHIWGHATVCAALVWYARSTLPMPARVRLRHPHDDPDHRQARRLFTALAHALAGGQRQSTAPSEVDLRPLVRLWLAIYGRGTWHPDYARRWEALRRKQRSAGV
jgi:putative amidoligase enzyme